VCAGIWSLLHVNPHRSPLGLGNFDANVLFNALRRRGMECSYHDHRKPVAGAVDPTSATLVGFIVNRPSTTWLPTWLQGRHWFSIRRLPHRGVPTSPWYNLDSGLPEPALITAPEGAASSLAAGSDDAVLAHLQWEISERRSTVIVVRLAEGTAAAGGAGVVGDGVHAGSTRT
jgi:hypothetical protein